MGKKSTAKGKTLESYINAANDLYRLRGVAMVFKQHPEITVLRSSGGKITSAFFKDIGTPDYVGISHGRAFTFEAKESSRHSFPFENIEDHQFEFMKNFTNQGGYAFFIIMMEKHGETFFVPYKLIAERWKAYKGDGRKSFDINEMRLLCDTVKPGANLALDYLPNLWRELK